MNDHPTRTDGHEGPAPSQGPAPANAPDRPTPEGPSAAAPISVVIVDDDPLVGASLRTIVEARGTVAVAAVGTRGAEAAALYEEVRPDILLLDIRMPDLSGLAAAEAVLAAHPHARIVFLTTFADDDYIVRALALGARGYLIKQEAATLEGALHAVMEDRMVLGGDVTERLSALIGRGAVATAPAAHGGGALPAAASATAGTPAPSAPSVPVATTSPAPTVAPPSVPASASAPIPAFAADLTDRERDIAGLIAEGLDNREIAGTLYLSEGTVRNHISAILQKCALKNRTQIAIAWWR